MNTFKITQQAKRLINSGKKTFFFLTVKRPICTNSYWDGGSRSEFVVQNIRTGARFVPASGQYPFTALNDYTLKSGEILIKTGTFCGKPAIPVIYCLVEDEAEVKQFLGIFGMSVETK